MPVTNVKTRWNAGDLEFYDPATGTNLLAIKQSTGLIDFTAGISFAGTPRQYTVTCYAADIGTAGSTFVVCPFAGTIKSLQAVNHVANATTKTVLTAKIATVAVTAPAWEVAVTAAAGTATIVTPTAANVVTAGQVVEIAYDGGSSAVEPATFTIVIQP